MDIAFDVVLIRFFMRNYRINGRLSVNGSEGAKKRREPDGGDDKREVSAVVMKELTATMGSGLLAALLLLLSCGHTIGQSRETVPFSCSWYRRSCEECLSAMRAGGQRAGLVIVDRAECPPCREEDQACRLFLLGSRNGRRRGKKRAQGKRRQRATAGRRSSDGKRE